MGHGSLRESYPATISMGQLYRICHISKRKARWLLEQGIIPCVDSGKKTRRFSIQLEDVIIFLERRDAGLLEDAIPRGAFSGGSRPVCPARRDAGKIKGLNYRRATLLSKESLACWLASPGGQNIAALSEQHLAWMKDFQAVKQNSGMGPGPMPL